MEYQFPTPALINYHKLWDLRHALIRYWRSDVQNQFHWTKVKLSVGLSGGSKEEPVPLILQLLRVLFLGSLSLPSSSVSAVRHLQISPGSRHTVYSPTVKFPSAS